MLMWLARGDLRRAARVLVPRRGTVHAVFSGRDPLPILARAGKLVSMCWRAAARQPMPGDR
jgi:hypothetical protein